MEDKETVLLVDTGERTEKIKNNSYDPVAKTIRNKYVSLFKCWRKNCVILYILLCAKDEGIFSSM